MPLKSPPIKESKTTQHSVRLRTGSEFMPTQQWHNEIDAIKFAKNEITNKRAIDFLISKEEQLIRELDETNKY